MKIAIRILVAVFALSGFGVSASAQSQTVRSDAKVRIAGEDFWVHAVAKGDTFYSLGKVYGVADSTIVRYNPLTRDGLKVGQMIKIPVVSNKPAASVAERPVMVRKGFRQHVVQKGETAYSISKLYEIPLSTLIDDNKGMDPLHIAEGEVLLIRKKEQGDATVSEIHKEWVDYKDAINSVSTDVVYHIVRPGETLYALGKQYNVAVEAIANANGITDGNLKVLSMVRIPMAVPEGVAVADSTAVDGGVPVVTGAVSDVLNHALSKNEQAEVALMLPVRGNEKADRNFLDFYQGVLVAMDEIKQEGLSVALRVYNTARDVAKVNQIVCQPEFADVDLVIGPVYSDELAPVLRVAEARKVPVISPLSTVNVSSDVLFQAAPDAAAKYAKIDSLMTPGSNIVMVTSERDEKEFVAEMQQVLKGIPYKTYHYDPVNDAGEIVNIIDWNRPNLFVVPAADEVTVDKTLAGISSAYNNTSARTARTAEIRVLGQSKWVRYNALDKNLYFKLGVCYVSSFHVDRTNARVRAFDARYIAAYGEMPSLYAYKGYDVAKSFVRALFTPGSSFDDRLNCNSEVLLQMPYNYSQAQPGAAHLNREWIVVEYTPDYNIKVK
ncbi:MAG: LysM peptidoglycan-binding domain-containing protein [Rikenellaceae bacterium]|nr:LysM peptidoglycan-binding domain-containing protein [Rikenellaceae bacterium]